MLLRGITNVTRESLILTVTKIVVKLSLTMPRSYTTYFPISMSNEFHVHMSLSLWTMAKLRGHGP